MAKGQNSKKQIESPESSSEEAPVYIFEESSYGIRRKDGKEGENSKVRKGLDLDEEMVTSTASKVSMDADE